MDRISKAPDHIVRAVLVALCNDYAVEKKALAYLEKVTAKEAVGSGSGVRSGIRSKTGNGTANGNGSSLKRKADSAIKICVRCKEPFYPEDNVGKPCRYHNGELEVDDDFWADHDEDCHGPIDTPENREVHPEGFFWDCCDKPGDDAEGCARGSHRAADDARARV